MSTQTEQLAARFEAVNQDLIAAVEGCSAARWQQPCSNEERPINVVAHHVGETHRAFSAILTALSAGNSVTPGSSMEDVHRANAEHARAHAGVSRNEVLDVLRTNGATIAQQLRSLDDDQLGRTAGTFGGNELSVQQVAEFVIIGHAAEHLQSISTTLAG